MPVQRSNQLSYEATDVGKWSIVGPNVPVMNASMNEMIHEMNHILNFSARRDYSKPGQSTDQRVKQPSKHVRLGVVYCLLYRQTESLYFSTMIIKAMQLMGSCTISLHDTCSICTVRS